MRCAIYCRISLDRTGQELGVERQREDCLALVERRGDTLADTFIDNDKPAKGIGKRDEYARLIAAVQRGEIDRIYVWSQGRLWRNRIERAQGFEILRLARVSLVQVKGPEVDMATGMGRMIAGIIGEFDTGENEIKAERQERENLQRAERGLPPGGRRAFGFDRTGSKQVRREAVAVKQAYQALLDGKGLSGIAAGLNAAGHTTTMGGLWKHNTVRNMLQNPRYAGLRSHKGHLVGKATWRPIVAEETWRAACDLLADPGRRTNLAGSALRWLGTGLYWCPRCPDATFGSTYRERYADGSARRVYKCATCSMSRSAPPIDGFVEALVVKRLRQSDLTRLFGQPTINTAPLHVEAAALRARLNALADNLDIDEQALARRGRKIRERMGEIEEALVEAGRGSAVGSLLGAKDRGAAWLAMTDVGQRQQVVRDLMTIHLLPVGGGRRAFHAASVRIDWTRR